MTYRELSRYVLRSKGRLEVTNPDAAGLMRVAVFDRFGDLAGAATDVTLDRAAAACAASIRAADAA